MPRLLTRLLPRLLAVLLVACGALVAQASLGAGPAVAACRPTGADLGAQAKAANAVFSGEVATRAAGRGTVVYTVTVDRVFKGRVSTAQVAVSTAATARACGLPDLRRGDRAVFFATGTPDELTIVRRSGTRPASSAYLAAVTDLLGAGRPATPPAPVQVEFTKVAGRPTELRRVAAPGAALVIVGLLGLALSGLRRRRRA